MNILKTIKTQLHTFRLTDTERADMRVHLAHHMHTYVPQRSLFTPSPYLQHTIRKQFAVSVASILAVMITGGTGLAYASFDSLPGDALYTVKVTTEEVQAAIKTSPEARAAFEVKRVERRITEAVALASAGELSEAKKETISNNLKRHTEKVAIETEKLSKEKPEEALEVNALLAITLEAQSDIIVTTAPSEALAVISQQITEAQVEAETQKVTATETLIASGSDAITQEQLDKKKAWLTTALKERSRPEPETATVVTTTDVETVITVIDEPTTTVTMAQLITEPILETTEPVSALETELSITTAAVATPEEIILNYIAAADELAAIGNFTEAFLKLQEAEEHMLKLQFADTARAAETFIEPVPTTPAVIPEQELEPASQPTVETVLPSEATTAELVPSTPETIAPEARIKTILSL